MLPILGNNCSKDLRLRPVSAVTLVTGQILLLGLHSPTYRLYLASNVWTGCDNKSDTSEHSHFLAL